MRFYSIFSVNASIILCISVFSIIFARELKDLSVSLSILSVVSSNSSFSLSGRAYDPTKMTRGSPRIWLLKVTPNCKRLVSRSEYIFLWFCYKVKLMSMIAYYLICKSAQEYNTRAYNEIRILGFRCLQHWSNFSDHPTALCESVNVQTRIGRGHAILEQAIS